LAWQAVTVTAVNAKAVTTNVTVPAPSAASHRHATGKVIEPSLQGWQADTVAQPAGWLSAMTADFAVPANPSNAAGHQHDPAAEPEAERGASFGVGHCASVPSKCLLR